MKTFLFVFPGSAFLALVITPVVIRLARRLNVVALTNRDGTRRTLRWKSPGCSVGSDGIVTTTLPIRDRRAGFALNLELQVHVNDSLESASRRIALFGRLLEQYSIANLGG